MSIGLEFLKLLWHQQVNGTAVLLSPDKIIQVTIN
jgi:hypothetical protein